MATTNPKPKPPVNTSSTQRLPAPALFVGPPSRNTSNNSLARPPAAGHSTSSPHPPTSANLPSTPPSARARGNTLSSTSSPPQDGTDLSRTTTQQTPPGTASSHTPSRRPRPRPSKAKIDAQWADLQSTLADVELTAAGTHTHVFGAKHADALKELRDAQIALAKAWAPGPEGGESVPDEEKEGKRAEGAKDRDQERGKEERKVRRSIGEVDEEGRGERDLSNAAARREANEVYFRKVKEGVQDVVGKLDKVSVAMRKVEMESREIWGDGESLASAPTNTSDG